MCRASGASETSLIADPALTGWAKLCRAAGAECSVGVGWEEDVPELRGGSGELNGNEGALGIHLRRADNMGFDALLGFWVFDSELSA